MNYIKYPGGKWIPMFGNIPFCGPIPIVKGQNINFLARKWDEKEHVEFLAIILLTQVMHSKFRLYEAKTEAESKVINLNATHITPLRKHPFFNLVSLSKCTVFTGFNESLGTKPIIRSTQIFVKSESFIK